MSNKKRVFLQDIKSYKNTRYGCGGRTRTYDLRVMSGFQGLLSNLKVPKTP